MGIRRFKSGLIMTALCLGLWAGLAGCGNEIPELTESEMKAVGEYAAFTVMKYDASNRSRLVDLPPEKEPVIPEPSVPEPPQETEEPSGMGPTDNVPITDNSQQQDSMEEVLGLADGLSVTYVDAQLYDSYPDMEEIGVVMNASDGRKLLVMRFSFLNGTEEAQQIDIAGQRDLNIRVTVNEEYRRSALMSMVMDDMMTLQKTLSPGESLEAVLIIETELQNMEEINSISLNLKNDEKAHTIQLK